MIKVREHHSYNSLQVILTIISLGTSKVPLGGFKELRGIHGP